MHDCGTILHPAMVDGQIRGGFAQALGAALYEEYAYAADGSFLTGTFADYLLPTTMRRCRIRSSSTCRRLRRSRRWAPRASAKAIACRRRSVSPTRSPMRSGAKDIELPLVPAKLVPHRARRRAGAAGRSRRRRHRETERRPASARRRRSHGRRAGRARLGHAARPRDASGGHSRLPQRRENLRHAFPRRGDARYRSGEGTLPRRRQTVRPRSAACGHARRLRRRRARIRQRRRTHHPRSDREWRHRDPLRLRGGDRRQGGEHRRSPARRRRAGDHRPVLCGAGAPGRRRRSRSTPSFLACEAACAGSERSR